MEPGDAAATYLTSEVSDIRLFLKHPNRKTKQKKMTQIDNEIESEKLKCDVVTMIRVHSGQYLQIRKCRRQSVDIVTESTCKAIESRGKTIFINIDGWRPFLYKKPPIWSTSHFCGTISAERTWLTKHKALNKIDESGNEEGECVEQKTISHHL